MKNSLVYLAGPITGLSYDKSANWREYVSKKLPKHIKALSPLRGKDYLKSEKALEDFYDINALSTQKGITCRDRYDVMRCDLIFVNLLGATRISIGTVMEIAWADILRKPIILVMEDGNIHSHSMIREVSGYIVKDLEIAITITQSIFS